MSMEAKTEAKADAKAEAEKEKVVGDVRLSRVDGEWDVKSALAAMEADLPGATCLEQSVVKRDDGHYLVATWEREVKAKKAELKAEAKEAEAKAEPDEPWQKAKQKPEPDAAKKRK